MTRTAPSPAPGPNDARADALAGTLARGLAILDVMIMASRPLTLAEVSNLAKLEQSTALRLLRVLEDAEYVIRNAATKRYSPSPKSLRPLTLLHPLEQLRRESAVVVRDAASDLQHTVVFALFIGHERMVVEIAQQPGSLNPYYGTWLKGPLYASGAGKSLLVGLQSEQRRALLEDPPWHAWTTHTITQWDDLEADLALSRERGYVVSRDEHLLGVTAIGAPVTTWAGTAIGCLVMTGPSRDLNEERVHVCGERTRHAAELLRYQAPSLELAALFCGHS